jgi:hypothetical protein
MAAYKLGADQSATLAYNFLLKSVPAFKDWTLVSYKVQPVAGTNYSFNLTSNGKCEVPTVYYKAWENYLSLTLPNGTVISQGGKTPIVFFPIFTTQPDKQ